jgi:hypothetical protein
MKVRIKVQPSGLLNAEPWPEAGETIDLPDAVAEEMIASGALEAIKEKPAKKAAAKKAAEPADKVEKRPASTKGVETRKKD